ncbi:MAG: F0F1 ATP synthase subunit gamma [Bacteroides sp.]
MASLKEVKGRIASVESTRKITSAMKMVASSKLHKAQIAIENMLPYERRLNHILTNFLSSDVEINSPFINQRTPSRVAIVVFSSNTSLCGGFNSNIIKNTISAIKGYKKSGTVTDIQLYPVGKKITDALKKEGFKIEKELSYMADKPSFQQAADLAFELMELYQAKKIDKVELIYNHFKSTAVQVLTHETYLPITLKRRGEMRNDGEQSDYIVEPSQEEVIMSLIPKVLRMKLYTVLLDSNASEHAARTMAMQTATDNANDLIQDLTVLYNKSRQQAITNELLDIIGGSMK